LINYDKIKLKNIFKTIYMKVYFSQMILFVD